MISEADVLLLHEFSILNYILPPFHNAYLVLEKTGAHE